MKKLLARLEGAIFLVPAFFALSLLLLSSTAAFPATLPPHLIHNDYLDVVCSNGVFRWLPERMPLRVYIMDGSRVAGYRASYASLMASAFDEWSKASYGRLTWTRASSPRQADIVCGWESSPEASFRGGVEAGVTKTIIEQDYRGRTQIRSATINILTGLYGRSFNDNEIRKTCLHEVGHALGLQGHSNVPSDIMFPALNPQTVAYLQERDVNTINRLYANMPATNSADNAIAQGYGGRNGGGMSGGYGGGYGGGGYSGGTYGGGYPSVREQPDMQLPQGDFSGAGYPRRQGPAVNRIPRRQAWTDQRLSDNDVGDRGEWANQFGNGGNGPRFGGAQQDNSDDDDDESVGGSRRNEMQQDDMQREDMQSDDMDDEEMQQPSQQMPPRMMPPQMQGGMPGGMPGGMGRMGRMGMGGPGMGGPAFGRYGAGSMQQSLQDYARQMALRRLRRGW